MNQGDKLTIELLNPNVSFKDNKDGPVHRLSFEVDEDTWNTFKHANKAGMILTAELTVTEAYATEGAAERANIQRNPDRGPGGVLAAAKWTTFPAADWTKCPDCDEMGRDKAGDVCKNCKGTGMVKKKKRHMNATEIRAIELCRDEQFIKYVMEQGFDGGPILYVRMLTKTNHRYEIEKTSASMIAFTTIQNRFEAWLKKNG